MEYEAVLAWNGEELKTCPRCESQTHQRGCPVCKNPDGSPLSLSGNMQLDSVLGMVEAGEDIEDLESILRAGFKPVPRGDLG